MLQYRPMSRFEYQSFSLFVGSVYLWLTFALLPADFHLHVGISHTSYHDKSRCFLFDPLRQGAVTRCAAASYTLVGGSWTKVALLLELGLFLLLQLLVDLCALGWLVAVVLCGKRCVLCQALGIIYTDQSE